jgi:PmbA protein
VTTKSPQELRPEISESAEPFVGEEARNRLLAVVESALAEASRQGASAAEAGVNAAQGRSVTVRLGEVETVEHTRDKGLGLTVYFGQRSGSASTTDLTPAAVRETVRAACTIARYTAEDDCAGLADADRLAKEIPALDLHHPWNLTMEKAIGLATKCEAAARGVDKRITNSEGATVSSQQGLDVYGNSHGFRGVTDATRHSISCSVIAQNGGGMQRDYWYTVARAAPQLEDPTVVGERADQRALKRLEGRKLSTRHCPVIYEAPVAGSLLSHFVSAVRGGSLYRRASFLLDHVGRQVFAAAVRLHEQPHLPRALGSAGYDAEGVATVPRDLVREGVLLGYVLDSYSARKLRMPTTGNAGGVHNLTIDTGTKDLTALLRTMDRGLLVTELIGFGVNTVTGDYSRGAAGFWVEHGEIQYPVEEITVAANLRDMFRGIVEIGNDVDLRSNIRTGSILIDKLTVAGG